ncbi:scavenger receptor cysteine-rich domain superfamily protein-like [Lytechinus variegatus]|uniref:scavenger receptor cysteine-rich domain superfamily protein-like n=1 Tax=Lytechinus variegatus TaxID=7654 RepID=UPI001BB13B02|nr:scavenger receptor cysteine-rich domain superfamily protein-like [Lytechinus variegatus]
MYENNYFAEWCISAPHGRRILVTFNYCSLESNRDYIDVIDENSKSYSGENVQFPPYLAKGNKLRIEFSSSRWGRRKGFNISLACHEPARDNILVRLMGGIKPSEGFIELSSSGDWMIVCNESFTVRVAEVICSELGYPGVKDITFVNVNAQNCTRAPSCGNDTYRLIDCTAGNSSCESDQVVKIKCHEPGYKGCYELQTQQLQNTSKSEFSTVSQCINLCKQGASNTSCKPRGLQTHAFMNKTACFCSTHADVDLNDLSKTCTDDSLSFSIYDASVGFCDNLNDTIGGSWDSNITRFGSIINLTCMYGYTLKGNGTIQCVPGVTPYYPIWNDSIPECELEGG